MKHNYRSISALAAIALLSLIHSTASAQTQPTISYQGVLQSNGANVNGTDTLKILIYTAQTGGSPIYTETQAVPVQSGIFNLAIGAVTPLLPTLDFTKQYFLAVSVNGAPELSPRSEVSFAPYAFRALNADTASYSTTAARATIANTVSGGVVTSVNGLYGSLSLAGTNGITVTNNNPPNIIIGSTGVQSLNGAGGIISLVGSGGTTIADSGTTITIRSATFVGAGGTVVTDTGNKITIRSPALQNTDGAIAITNGSGPLATINLARQSANYGQVLEWNDSVWRPATLSNSQGGPDSINQLVDARSFDYNLFLGSNSGRNDTVTQNPPNGNNNTAIGIGAMQDNTRGMQNTACGTDALGLNTTGSDNTAFGLGALAVNTVGNGNVAVGSYALSGFLHGDAVYGNVAVGHYALILDSSGGGNVAIGYYAMSSNNSGGGNTACGYNAMLGNGSGQYNVGIGNDALYFNQTGNDNTAIGDSAGPTSSNLNNTISLGSGAQPTASNEVVLGNANVTSLYCQGAYAATTASSANMVVASNGQIMRSTSSARYKTDIHDLDINTDKLYDLRPVSYTSKIDGKEYFGLVAEDVAKVIPDLAEYARAKDVIPGSTSDALIPDAVKYPMLSVLLLEELKKEHAKVKSEETRAESQGKIIFDLAKRVEALEEERKEDR